MNNINKMFKDWGSKKQILPSDNEAMKEKILSKIPFNIERHRSEEKKKVIMPWTSFAFASIAVVLFIISPFLSNKSSKPLYDMQSVSFRADKKIAKENVYLGEKQESIAGDRAHLYQDFSSAGINESMKNYFNDDSFLLDKTDNREFLKIYYNAEIKARKVADTVSSIGVIVHLLGGRVDSSSSGSENGYMNFSVPRNQFDLFRSQIKDLTHDFLFIENTISDNLLPQKQAIEEEIKNAQTSLTSLKAQKIQIIKDHEGMIAHLNMNLDVLNKEAKLLQAEWQTASTSRKLEITARLAQIQGEKNSINSQIQTENVNYINKISSLNLKINVKQENLNDSKKEDQNLIDSVSMITGTISIAHVNLLQYVDAFIPGPLIAWVFGILSILIFFRYWFVIRII